MDFLNVGIIQNTHGLKGELKIRNLSDFDRFIPGNTLYILHNSEYIEVVVKSHRTQRDLELVIFEGLDDINLVEKYKGDKILISKNDLTPLDEGKYYYYELIGKNVYNQNGLLRGKVTSVIKYPQSDMLEVDVAGKKRLVPFIDEFIISVDLEKIVIKEIEGLLWK